MMNLGTDNAQNSQLHYIRELTNYIRNGLPSEIEKMDRESIVNVVNTVQPDVKQTPLLTACLFANQDIGLTMVKLLTERGSNPSLKDINQQTVMYYLARDGKQKIAAFLLEDFNFNLNDTDNYFQTPIFYAARENRLNMVELFVSKGANVNHKDQNKQTCLFYAARNGHYEMCRLLIKVGVEISHLDIGKKSALFFAKKQGHQNIVQLLTAMKQQQKKVKEVDKSKEKDSSLNDRRKPKKESPKSECVLIFTDQAGNVHELDDEQLEQFKKHNQKIFNLMCNPELLELEPNPPEKKFQRVANKILTNLYKQPGGIIFHNPVDWEALGLRDYPTIVKKPMDFGTVKIKLQNNAYESHLHFTEDMTQVFDNCILYNGSEHEFGRIAINLKNQFHQMMISQVYI